MEKQREKQRGPGEEQSGPGWKLSPDGKTRVPDGYNPYNPEHRMNAETITFREGDAPGPALDYSSDDDDGLPFPLITYPLVGVVGTAVTAGTVAGYPIKQLDVARRKLAGIPPAERKTFYSGKPFWQDATSAVRGIGNMTGYRTPSGLSQKEKEFAQANPSDDSLSDAQRKYLDDRKGLLRKGGRSRKVRRAHKRKSIRKGKGKGKKTRKTRKAKRSRKSRK